MVRRYTKSPLARDLIINSEATVHDSIHNVGP